MCRKSDPESKGKIESVVKFIKYNFIENRLFVDENILNSTFLDWLERTGNAKVHSTTKKVPAEVFEDERDYLRPLLNLPAASTTSIFRTVRKDNTIIFDSNRYSLPLGTYGKHKDVCVDVKNNQLIITDAFGDYVMCTHNIATGRGVLIKSTTHKRDRESTAGSLQYEVAELLEGQANNFLDEIRHRKSRYSRDQFQLLKLLLQEHGKNSVLNAINFCESNRLYSVNYVKDLLIQESKPQSELPIAVIPVSNKKYHVKTEKRSLEVYAKVGGSR
jgi:hypothetical protein